MKFSIRAIKHNKTFIWIAEIFRSFYLFFPGILFLFLYYFIIVVLPLGQDLLMQSGEDLTKALLTVLDLCLWLLVSWFSSRLIADLQAKIEGRQNDERERTIIRKKLYSYFPRMLGYNVAVGLQAAILNLPTTKNVSDGWLFLFLLAHNVYYFLVVNALEKNKLKWSLPTAVLAFGYYTWLAFDLLNAPTDGPERHKFWLILMSMIFFSIQLYFVVKVITRRKKLENNIYAPGKTKQFKRLFDIISLFAFILYLPMIFFADFAQATGGLGCALLAFCILSGFIALARYLGRKIGFRFGLPVLLIAVLIGKWEDPYGVQLTKNDVPRVFETRPTLDTFTARWIRERSPDISKGDYTAYMVIADGGASRSGYWVSSVLSKLDSASKGEFSSHLFSLAGASGGSVGNTVFYCMLDSNLRKGNLNYAEESTRFFGNDFLTYSLARFLGPDLFRHIFPFIPMEDRAAALATSMENSESKAMSVLLRKNISSYFDATGKKPMLLMNVTNLQTGRPAEISSIKLDSTLTGRIDILSELDLLSLKDPGKGDMHVSTAMLLGARFPFLSPAGKIGNYYYNDGGYFDNTGAGITYEILDYLEKKILSGCYVKSYPLLDKIKFKVIYISNGSVKEKELRRVHPLLNDLTAPMLTIMNTRGEQTELVNVRLLNFLKNSKMSGQSAYPNIHLPILKHDTVPYPMNWVISDYNLHRMRMNLPLVKTYEGLSLPLRRNADCEN